METRSDRINYLLADLDQDDRERIKTSIRNLAADALQRADDGEPVEDSNGR